ncbi:MX2 [Symbiodinium sp. CCMP2456]|nr:MX2 [Symbiodinium sp. CCMP2456]
MIKGNTELELTASACFIVQSAGEGQFKQKDDRTKLVQVLQQALQRKLRLLMMAEDLVGYRVHLNLQGIHLRGFPAQATDDLVPGFAPDSFEQDACTLSAQRFLYQNGFATVHEVDAGGWSPGHYAALRGDPLVLQGLLQLRAEINRWTRKDQPLAGATVGTTMLGLAGFLKHHQLIRLLISARATTDFGLHPDMAGPACANDPEGILCRAGSRPFKKNLMGDSALEYAATWGSLEALEELVLQAGLTVAGRMLFAAKSLQHRFGRSTLMSRWAYHRGNQTPLMAAVMSRQYEGAAALIAAGARLDLRNSRNWTAADFASGQSVPEFLMQAFEGQLEGCQRVAALALANARVEAFGSTAGVCHGGLNAQRQAVLKFLPARDSLLFGSRSDLVSCSSVCPSSSAVTAAMDATQRRSYRKFLQILHEKPMVADFMCPIGGRPMTDPVVAEDGYSYERSAIEAWLQEKEVSPQTRNPMGSALEGNSDLKEAIDELQAVVDNPPSEELTITWNAPGPTPLQRTLVISPPAETSDSSDWEAVEVLTPTSPAKDQSGVRQRAAQSQDMSYTLSKIFRVLDPLRGLLLEVLDGWTPQRMIVVGDESAGKSTILEMLAMLPIFPRKRRFCTRLATHLRLRRNPDVCRTTLSVYTVTPQGDELEGEAMVVPKENGHLFVQEKMDQLVSELSKGEEGAGSGGIVTRKIIVIEVQGPEVPSIDLVDLPGITSWPKEKAEAVQQIMKKQIRDDENTGNNNMFLAVVPASGDVKPNTNNAMKFIMENQLQDDRTVGVFSKCDQTSRSGSDILRALTLNESTKEGESAESLGRIDLQTWVASMLEPPQEFSNNFERLELQRKNEVEFFEKADENFQHVFQQGHAGMRALIANIERSYLKHLNTTWKPHAMRKVLLKEKDVDFQLCMLGLVEDETARSSLAKEEVERRLGVTSPVTKSVYEDFILRALRKDLAVKVRERLQRYSGSGLTCEGCEQREEMNLLEKDLMNLISGACLQGLVGCGFAGFEARGALDQMESGLVTPLQSWLYAKSEVVQIPNTDFVNVCTKFSDGFSLMHFGKDLSKKELVQKLHSEPILQLCSWASMADGCGLPVTSSKDSSAGMALPLPKRGNYSGYLDEIMSKCKQMHVDAGTRILNKAAQLVANLVNLDGSSDRRMEVQWVEGLRYGQIQHDKQTFASPNLEAIKCLCSHPPALEHELSRPEPTRHGSSQPSGFWRMNCGSGSAACGGVWRFVASVNEALRLRVSGHTLFEMWGFTLSVLLEVSARVSLNN